MVLWEVWRDFKCREAEGHPLLFAKGFARALGDWLLRELCFFVSGSKPLLLKGGVGEDCQGLSAKGFASRRDAWRWLWRRELATTRAVGSLRDAFPLPAGGIPAKSQTNEILHGSRREHFFVLGLLPMQA